MNKAERKNKVFEAYEQRVEEFRHKYKDHFNELLQLATDLVQDYGDVAREDLMEIVNGHLFIGLPDISALPDIPVQPFPVPEAKTEEAVKPLVGKKAKGKHRRKRASRKPGEPTITDLLRKGLPTYLATAGAEGNEFTAREVFELMQPMQAKGLVDKRIGLNHVSLYLGQHAREHNLKVVQRQVQSEGSKAPVTTNFFSIAGSKKSGKKTSERKTRGTGRKALAFAKELVAGEFKGRVFTPPKLAASLKKHHGIVLRNIHATICRLVKLKLIKRVGKGQYEA